MDPQELVDRIHKINTYEHKILYYGPEKPQALLDIVKQYHNVPEKLVPVPAATELFLSRIQPWREIRSVDRADIEHVQ